MCQTLKPNLVEEGIATIVAILPVRCHCISWCACVGEWIQPNGLIPKGSPGELPRGMSWVAFGVSKRWRCVSTKPCVQLHQNNVSARTILNFLDNNIIENYCRVLIVVEQTSEAFMFFTLALSSDASNGMDPPLRTMGSRSFNGFGTQPFRVLVPF